MPAVPVTGQTRRELMSVRHDGGSDQRDGSGSGEKEQILEIFQGRSSRPW